MLMGPRNISGTNAIPAQAGIGLRFQHHQAVVDARPDVPWLEVHTENYMGGGTPIRYLEAIRRDTPISLHGVGLSLGSAEGIDPAHLARFLPDLAKVRRLVVVDAVGDDPQRWLYKNLTGLGYDRLSTEGAAELAAVGAGISAPLLGATARATECVTLESLEAVVADPAGARRGFEECRILEGEQLAEAVNAAAAKR